MIDFTQLSEEEILTFIDSHFDQFSSERDQDFPMGLLDDLAGGMFVTIRRVEGFAFAYKGRHRKTGQNPVAADLMFLYVRPEFQGEGIGSQIVDQVKKSVTPGVPMVLTCEGVRRRRLFEKCGFVVYKEDGEDYEMRWSPAGPTSAN